jgi:hypothetical protein
MVGFIAPKTTYERPGLGETDEADPHKAADLFLTAQIAETIQKHYPGHAWMIEVSHAQRVAMLSIPLFMGRNKWVIHIDTLKSDPTQRAVMRAAGEILERYKIPRNAFGLDDFLMALEGIPKSKRAHHGVLAE